MVSSSELLLLAAVVVFMTALGLALILLHMGAVTGRLRLALNLFGLAVVAIAGICGVALIAGWLASGRLELLIMAVLPLAFAGAIFNLLTRRHMPWYEPLAGRGGTARWRGLWNEIQADRGSGGPGPMAREASGPVPAGQEFATGHPGTAPSGPTRTFSFSFGTGHSASRLLGPMLELAAHRLSKDRISVFPPELHLMVVLDTGAGRDRSYLDSFRHQLTVRRSDGGHLILSATSDIPFLDLAIGSRRADGSHAVEIGLIPKRLVRGPFSGTISIRTDDPVQPRLAVPVTGTIE